MLLLLVLLASFLSSPASAQPCASGFYCPNATAPALPCACAFACPATRPDVTTDSTFSGVGYFWAITTLAGTGAWSSPSVSGPGTSATFNNPSSMGLDLAGNLTFIFDYAVHSIRPMASNGSSVSFLAGGDSTTGGFADGASTAARFNQPRQGVRAPSGVLFFADGANHRIRMVQLNGTAGTFAGNGTAGLFNGPLLGAMFNGPCGLALDSSGVFYVADTGSNAIRRIAGGAVGTLAGTAAAGYADGVGTAARFWAPYTVAVTPNGATLFVADRNNARVRRIATTTGLVSTLAGNGSDASGSGTFGPGAGTAAAFHNPTGVGLHPNGAALVVAEIKGNRLRLLSTLTGQTTLVAGSTSGVASFSDSPTGAGALLNTPSSALWAPGGGSIIFTDSNNKRVRGAACAPCPAGFFCAPNALSQTIPRMCAAGSWSAAGSLSTNASCAPCAAAPGSFCGVACGVAGGAPCPAGFFCAGGAAAPAPCLLNPSCPAGSAVDAAPPPPSLRSAPPAFFARASRSTPPSSPAPAPRRARGTTSASTPPPSPTPCPRSRARAPRGRRTAWAPWQPLITPPPSP